MNDSGPKQVSDKTGRSRSLSGLTFKKAPISKSGIVRLAVILAGLNSIAAVQVTTDANRGKDHKQSGVDVVERKIQKGDGKIKRAATSMTRAEAFLIATEQKLGSEIEKTISYLRRIEPRTAKGSPERLRILEQLLNLNMELGLYKSNDEFRAYDEAYERWDANGRRGREPRLSVNKSQQQWKVVARRATDLLRQYPRARNADETTFNLAVAYQFLKREKDAARTYTQLITKYPNSPKAGDAYFQLGDFYFDKLNFRAAMNNYKQALRYKRSRGYSWALFKLGWCYYNLGDFQKSLEFWKSTVANARRSSDQSVAQLKDEALRDMVYAFAELKLVDPAINYYRANGGEKYIGKFLLLLASVFTDQGRYGQAIATLKRFQQVAPGAPEGPDAQKDILSLNYELGRWNTLWSELADFPKQYGPGSRWESANRGDRQLVLETQALIKDQVLYYGKIAHKSAQKNDDVRRYREALKGYQLFLRFYPTASESVEVKFNMADIEYFLKRYRIAGKLYLDIAMLPPEKAIIASPVTKKVTNVHRDSSRYMLDSYYLDFEPELKKLIKTKPDFAKPGKVSERAANFIKGCGYFQKWYPKDRKNIKTCDLYVAEIYFRLGDRSKAIKYLTTIAFKYFNDKEGPQAVESLIPLYKSDRNGLLAVAEKLLAIRAYQKGKLGDNLRNLKNAAKVEEIAKLKDPLQRAKAYEEQARARPKDSEADKLVYNAAIEYTKAGAIPQAIAMYSVILSRYRKSDQRQESMLQIAKLKDRRLEFEDAAKYYFQYAKEFSKSKNATAAIGRSCELLSAVDGRDAQNVCLTLAKVDPEGARALYARMIRSAAYRRRFERLNSLVKTYMTRLNPSPDERILAAYAVYNTANGRGSEAASAVNEIRQSYQKSSGKISGEALRYVGEVSFKRASVEVPKFAALKLAGGTVDKLAASIDRKATALNSLKRSMDQVIATKDSYWGVAALYENGRAFEEFADELANPPAIKGASAEDVKKQLAPQVQGARQEAAGFYKIAMETMTKFKVYNKYSRKVVTAVARSGGAKVTMEDWVPLADVIGAEVSETVAAEVR